MSSMKFLRRQCPHSGNIGRTALRPSCLTALRSHLAMYSRIKYLGDVNYEKYETIRDDVVVNSAVFNVEYSPRGNLLVGTLENGRILVVDPLTRRVIRNFVAHSDCANCLCFINDSMFVTGSDDCSVKVWDYRSPSQPVHTAYNLHTSWVKNVHYDAKSHSVLSSGFETTIRLWDITASENEAEDTATSFCFEDDEFLVRSALSKDGTVLCVASICVVATLEDAEQHCIVRVYSGVRLKECGLDLSGCFKGSIVDWPTGAEAVMSIRIFSDNNFVMSRCTDNDSREWMCVHCLTTLSMLYKITESSMPHGILKEPGISSDERVICSPFGNRVRLMAFDKHLCHVNTDCNGVEQHSGSESSLLELVDIKTPHFTTDPVLTCRFSSTQMLVAAGTNTGGIFFAQPRL